MKTFVANCDWGGALTADIRAVAQDVLGHFSKYFPDFSYLGTRAIVIQKSPDEVPRALFREELSDPFFVNLSISGNVWANAAYQFAHELCHVLSNHDKLRKPENQWFHESLCELASIFCVFQMAESWKTTPPYHQWKDYAQHLHAYGQEFLARPEHQLPKEPTLSNWLKQNIDQLRKNSCIRELNAIVAIKLLPIFQAKPELWESIAYIPDLSEAFDEFIKRWRLEVPEPLRASIDEIANVFEIAL